MSDSRHAAFACLEALEQGSLVHIADWPWSRCCASRTEAALARELALGSVRHERLYDWLADRHLRQASQPLALRLVLRLAAHQLFGCDRIPPHAACHASVDLLRDQGHGHLTGVANAVIRRLAEQRLDPARPGVDPPLARLAAQALPPEPALRHALPDALFADLPEDRRGEGDLVALNRLSPLATRTRPGRSVRAQTAVLRQDKDWTWWSDPAAALAEVAAGTCVVQDPSQGAALTLAEPRAGERVLDLCAAPGGKALYLADQGCRVIAADRDRDKAARMATALGAQAGVLVQDGRRPALAAVFDLAVVDAPCSGSGVFGRKPEAKRRYAASRERLTALQGDLLASAAGLVRPGGRLLYATCSVADVENHRIAAGLPGWRIAGERLSWPNAWQAGGYAALLVKT